MSNVNMSFLAFFVNILTLFEDFGIRCTYTTNNNNNNNNNEGFNNEGFNTASSLPQSKT